MRTVGNILKQNDLSQVCEVSEPEGAQAAYAARIATARAMFLFPVPADIDQILAEMENCAPYDATKVGDVIRDKIASFPTRHRLALASVMQAHQAAWDKTLAKILKVLLRPGGCIVGLLGPRGTGKTQLAVALARYLAEQSIQGNAMLRARAPATYASLPDLLIRVRATFNGSGRGNETEAGILAELSRVRLLVLDECHEAGGSEWARSFFTSLVDRRYRDSIDTLLISNEEPAAFARSIGSSVADRLRECGAVVECHWPSFRGGYGEVSP